jgi:UDPglucose 6-dehydrogenase
MPAHAWERGDTLAEISTMHVTVMGLWHLGSVTAACLASAGHTVIGFDNDAAHVEGLMQGRPPVAEPGLADILASATRAGTLTFTADPEQAFQRSELVWVCFDTSVDEDDRADVEYVLRQIEAIFPRLRTDTVVLVSSQLPVGSVHRLEQSWAPVAAGRRVTFACSPENLRLGKAIEVFRQPDRVIAGVRDGWTKSRVEALFGPVTDRIEWMGVESAEMTKHAINAFLATSVTFINELAVLCEAVGADAQEVERGLKTEQRIGPRAYLAPGGAIAGGTLARDVMFLRDIGDASHRPTPLLDGLVASNTAHRDWVRQRLIAEMGSLDGTTVAVWGLTYKPGTDTLRRSEAVELCRWLIEQHARVRVHDPAVGSLPPDLDAVERCEDPIDAASGATALVVATEWPVYRQVPADALAGTMRRALVLDPNRFLAKTLGQDRRFRLVAVGQPLA